VQKVPCNRCQKSLQTCVCEAPCKTTETSLNTAKGVEFRAAYRARKKREGLWFCGRCCEVTDIEETSAREWAKLQTGVQKAPNCQECRGLTHKVPASVLTCPRCQQVIRSSLFAGQVHIHTGADGTPYLYRFRFRDGVAYNPGSYRWLRERIVCERLLEREDFSDSGLGKRLEARKCTDGADKALSEGCRTLNNVRGKFFERCSGIIDVSGEPKRRRQNLRQRRTLSCAVCRQQGRPSDRRNAYTMQSRNAESDVQSRRALPEQRPISRKEAGRRPRRPMRAV